MIATPTVETPQLDTATGDTAATRDAGSGNADAGNAGAGNAGVATANIANLDSDLNASPTANTLNAAVSAVSDGSGTELTPGRTAAIAGLRDPDLEITIRAKASSWVEIVRDDGTSVVTKLMKAGETYIVDDGSTLYLSTGNAGGIELVMHDNDVIQLGAVGEIVRDLPLIKSRLKNRF
jgi:cytoskeleton protein RodZ